MLDQIPDMKLEVTGNESVAGPTKNAVPIMQLGRPFLLKLNAKTTETIATSTVADMCFASA